AGIAETYDAAGKLEPGDVILGVNGREVRTDHALTLQDIVNRNGTEPMQVEVLRQGERMTVEVAPQVNTAKQEALASDDPETQEGVAKQPDYRMGIVLGQHRARQGVLDTV